jgi:hypothetical protein
MRVLVGCEYSGVVRDAFIAEGHDAISCDFLPTDKPGPHYQGDVRDIWNDGFDLMVIHPDCTYVCGSGWHWNKRIVGRHMLSLRAIDFFIQCMEAPVPKICSENPVGVLSTYYRKPDQYIQPYEFGHDASKKTGLWLKNLPLLKPTKFVEPRTVMHNGKEVKRWANQTDSGQNKLPPSKDRWKMRAKTYQGWAQAMAQQWGKSS